MNPIKHAPPESLNIDIQSSIENIRSDKYIHIGFIGEHCPLAQEEAWRIHAEGYRVMNFINDEAIDDNGFLDSSIDKTRELTGSEYHISVNPYNENDRATLRIVPPPGPFGDYTKLPAYEATKNTLYPAGKQLLENLCYSGNVVKEISALAKTEKSSPLAIFELFREIIQDAQTKKEVWIFSMVNTTFNSLVKRMGESNLIVIGDDICMDDPRVNPEIKLRPVIFIPNLFYQNLMEDIRSTKDDWSRKRLVSNLRFFAEGLQDANLSESISTFLNNFD
jgi:hypothetical protein